MNVRVDLQETIYDGMEVKFRSPVDCSQVTGLKLFYPENDITTSQEFAFADAHGNNVGDIDHLFAENAVVKVILDLNTNMAFVQNADTNAYLEGRFADLEAKIGTGSGGGADLSEVISSGANLFDKTKAKLNTSFDGGNEIANNQRAVSDYIAVVPGESIAMTKCIPVTEVRCFTDIGAYKSRGTLTAIDENSTLLVVPGGVQYIRIEITHIPGNANYEYVDRMMVNRGTTLLPYEPYGKKHLNSDVEVPIENIPGLGAVAKTNDYNDLDNTPEVDTKVTADGENAVTGQAVFDFVANHSPKGEMTRNIFNKDDITIINANYFQSGLLEVEEDTDYVIFNQVFTNVHSAQMAASYAYDENGNKISALGEGTVNSFHTPIGARTVQLYMFKNASYENPWDYIMVEKGTEPSWIYEPYGNVDNFKQFFNSSFYGKKYVALGDSNTDQKEYPALLAVKLGMYYNPAKTSNGGCECGRGGATIWLNETIDSQTYESTSGICSQARIASVPEDAEIITLAGASNDAGQEKAMGVPSDMQMYQITSSDGTVVGTIKEAVVDVPAEPNFYNCYAVSINRIMQRCPNADIYICEIPFRSMQPYETSGNVKADFFAPYREAQKEVAKHYGLPLLKTYRDAGVNELNFKKFITSTENDFGIHWNFNGQKRLAEVMASGMLSARY